MPGLSNSRKLITFVGLSVCFASPVFGSILDVPTSYSNLETALAAAGKCDTIQIDSGTYSGTGFKGLYFTTNQCVYIRSKFGPEKTIINLGNDYFCDSDIGAGNPPNFITIQGIRFNNGYPAIHYRAFCEMVIVDCVFSYSAPGILAGSYAGGSYGGVFRSLFTGCSVGIEGQDETYMTVAFCTFYDNNDGIVAEAFPEFGIFYCTFVNNWWVAIRLPWLWNPYLFIENNVFYHNEYGIYSLNTANDWADDFRCNNCYGNTKANYVGGPDPTGKNGNISVDPLYCDTAGGRFTLATISPLLPQNNSCHDTIGNVITTACYCGDVDVSGNLDIGDVSALISYLYLDGPPPVPLEAGEIDRSPGIDIADLTLLIGSLYIDLLPLPCGS